MNEDNKKFTYIELESLANLCDSYATECFKKAQETQFRSSALLADEEMVYFESLANKCRLLMEDISYNIREV